MGIAWPEYTLGDLCRFKYGHMPRKTDLCDDGYPVFSGYNIVGYATTYHYEESEIIVVARGVGGTGDVKMSPPKCFLTNLSIVAKVVSSEVDKKFLYYRLAGPKLWELRTGSAQAQITIDRLQRYELRLPPLPTQHKIATILSAYDDLIENNMRRIKILEEMAQNLYREWFVKFRFPGHEKARFVDSSLGQIPEGWEIKALGSLMEEHIGGGWGNDVEDDNYTEPAWVIRGTDIPTARSCDLSKVPFRYHKKSNLQSRRLMPGDIVFEVSGGSKGQPLGRSLYISSELLAAFNGAPVICASFCKRIKPDTEQYASELLYLSFLDAYISGEIEQYQVQSTGISNYKWSDYLEKVSRCVPPIALQERFCELSAPLFSKISTLGRKNTNLRRTRDLLLPKLISGAVDVSELDIIVPEELSSVPDVQSEIGSEKAVAEKVKYSTAAKPDETCKTSADIDVENEPLRRTVPIEELDTNDVMAAFRKAIRKTGSTDRTTLLKTVSDELGYERIGSRIKEVLQGHLRAAIRRKIIGANGDDVWPETQTMEDYDRDILVATLSSVMHKGTDYDREYITREIANYLGFRRLTDTVLSPIKSAINAAIRRSIIFYEGSHIWRD